jgi:hypothetical protein
MEIKGGKIKLKGSLAFPLPFMALATVTQYLQSNHVVSKSESIWRILPVNYSTQNT